MAEENRHMLQQGTHSQIDTEDEIEQGITTKCDSFEISETEVQVEKHSTDLIYKISDPTPVHLTLFFGLQQALISLSFGVAFSQIVSETVCAGKNEEFKAKILSSILFMVGITTLIQVLFGVRLPIFQGASPDYIPPLLAIQQLASDRCTIDMTSSNNQTVNSTLSAKAAEEEMIIRNVQELQGGLIAAGCIHCLIGATGLVGVLLKFIGPVTIVPTILLVGLYVSSTVIGFSEVHWGVALMTAALTLILSMYLENKQMPIPIWSRKRSFHIIRYPLHQVLSILIALIFGWLVCLVMTEAGAFDHATDNTFKQFYARTDARLYVVSDAKWFDFPYPGQFGTIRFRTSTFIGFLVASMMSILDSVGDYYACASTCRVPLPPAHGVNRGIMVEGLCTAFSGAVGCGLATTTYGANVGAIGLTKVASRNVFICTALIYIVFGVIGKISAAFIIIPNPVLGGVMIAMFGVFIGVILSNLRVVSLTSTRNITIIGTAILMGLIGPQWMKQNPNAINTGNDDADYAIKMMLGNPSLISGVLSCFLDNTVPGTLEERGILAWQGKSSGDETKVTYSEGIEVYDPVYIPRRLWKLRFMKYIPFMPYIENH